MLAKWRKRKLDSKELAKLLLEVEQSASNAKSVLKFAKTVQAGFDFLDALRKNTAEIIPVLAERERYGEQIAGLKQEIRDLHAQAKAKAEAVEAELKALDAKLGAARKAHADFMKQVSDEEFAAKARVLELSAKRDAILAELKNLLNQ
jgi:hypothetical protein